MRWDIQVAAYWFLSAASLTLWATVAPDYIPGGLPRAAIFWGGLPGFLVFGLVGLCRAFRGEKTAKKRGNKYRMISLYGMLICAAGFLGFSYAYFFQKQPAIATSGVSTAGDQVVSGNDITLHDLFINDLNGRSYNLIQKFSTQIIDGKEAVGPIDFEVGLYGDFLSSSQFMGVYLPDTAYFKQSLLWFSHGYKDYIHDARTNIHLWTESPSGETQTLSDDLRYTGKLYVYHDNIISDAVRFELEAAFRSAGLEPIFRGFNYLQYQRKSSPPITRKPAPTSTTSPPNAGVFLHAFAPDPSNATDPSMLTLFMTDFKGDGKGLMTISKPELKLSVDNGKTIISCSVLFNIYYDRTHNAKHISIYIPPFPVPQQVAVFVAANLQQWAKNYDASVIASDPSSEWTARTTYDNKVYLYIWGYVDEAGMKAISSAFSQAGADVEIRGSSYWAAKVADVRAGLAPMPPKYELVNGVPVLSPKDTSLSEQPPPARPPAPNGELGK